MNVYRMITSHRFSKDDLFEGYKNPMLAVLFVSPTKTKEAKGFNLKMSSNVKLNILKLLE